METQKISKLKQSSERRMGLDESSFLTSDYTTQLPKQYGTGTKKKKTKQTNINTVNRTGQKPKDKPMYLWSPNL